MAAPQGPARQVQLPARAARMSARMQEAKNIIRISMLYKNMALPQPLARCVH
nr:hypothetical protein RVX_2277 [Nitratidesulfovibrio sp. HK-II]